jgi:hypothetical protein
MIRNVHLARLAYGVPTLTAIAAAFYYSPPALVLGLLTFLLAYCIGGSIVCLREGR